MRRAIILAAAAALALGACGDDAPDVAPDAADPAPVDAEVPDDGDPGDGDPGDVPDADDDVDEFHVEAPSEPVRVVYETNMDDFTRFVISVDPPRSVMIFDEGRMIDDGEGSIIFCSDDGGEQFCMRMDSGQIGAMAGAMFGSLFGVQDAIEAGMFRGQAITSRTQIAGRSAVCLEPRGHLLEADVESAEVCVDDDLGVMLRWRVVDADGDHQIEAVEIGDPDPSEFEPPVTPQEMPGGD